MIYHFTSLSKGNELQPWGLKIWNEWISEFLGVRSTHKWNIESLTIGIVSKLMKVAIHSVTHE